MTTYATGNPLPSTAIKDLYDNAENLDNLVNGPNDVYADRLGQARRSWRGIENDFNDFLAGSGFETPPLVYVDGNPLQVDRPTQLIERAGILYGIKLPSSFPVILTGTFATDEPLLVIRGDSALRQELADEVDITKGSALIGHADPVAPAYLKTVSDIINGNEVSLFRFISTTDHAAIRDKVGGVDVTTNLNEAMDAMREVSSGGGLFIPGGVYEVSGPVDYYMPGVRSLTMRGEDLRATQLRWTGTTGAMFTNEQLISNQFQYGFFMSDMWITARHGAIVQPVAGSTGIHLEMMQHAWRISNVQFQGFDTNIDIGVHSEGGMLDKVYSSYANTGCNLYGDQADAIVVHGSWFNYNKFQGMIISSPRPTIDSCMFVSQTGFSDATAYNHIRIGWKGIRTQDIGKSPFLTADKGNAAIKARIINSNFEGTEGTAAIRVANIDTAPSIFDGLSFENNFFAIYGQPTAIRFESPYNNVTTRANKLETTNAAASLLDVTANNMGLMDVEEPYVHRVFASNAQFWRNGAKRDDFNELSQVASSALFASPGWGVTNLGTALGITLVDLDYDGRNGIKVDYSAITPLAPFAFSDSTCPAGMIYMDFDIEATGNGRINIDARDAGNAVIFAKNSLRIGPSEKRRITIGFNNPSTQLITIRIYLQDFSGSGSLMLSEVLFKHGNGAARSFNTKNTQTGLRFTSRNNQVFNGVMRIPHNRISDVSNLATGHWYTGEQTFSTINNVGGYSSGATSIVVANATGMAIGDYMFFKANTASGVSPAYQSTLTTGNKISNIVGTTITLATGLPFAMADGNRVLTCKVFREAASTLL